MQHNSKYDKSGTAFRIAFAVGSEKV